MNPLPTFREYLERGASGKLEWFEKAECPVLAPFPGREGRRLMQERRYLTLEDRNKGLKQIVNTATERARAKNARLRLLKERNEAYLAAHKDELVDELEYVEQEITRELT